MLPTPLRKLIAKRLGKEINTLRSVVQTVVVMSFSRCVWALPRCGRNNSFGRKVSGFISAKSFRKAPFCDVLVSYYEGRVQAQVDDRTVDSPQETVHD